MKPRLILLLAVFVECFLLFVAFPRRDDPNQEAMSQSTQWRDDPTPEAERAIRREIVWEKWKPRLIWTLIGANGVFIFTCAARLGKSAAKRD